MLPCPNFDCLDYSQSSCEKYPACEGCAKLHDCVNCSNQASLIDGKTLPCDMILLPVSCRFCDRRQTQDFSPTEDCALCPSKLR